MPFDVPSEQNVGSREDTQVWRPLPGEECSCHPGSEVVAGAVDADRRLYLILAQVSCLSSF